MAPFFTNTDNAGSLGSKSTKLRTAITERHVWRRDEHLTVRTCCEEEKCCSVDFEFTTSRIYDTCEEPKCPQIRGAGLRDFNSQVTAPDLQLAICTQTGSHLAQSSSEQPKKRHQCKEVVAARRRSDISTDCDNSTSMEVKAFSDVANQTNSQYIDSEHSVQTGPSLTAAGPFCRFDYRLKKTKAVKEDPYIDCCESKEPASVAINCSDRYQKLGHV